MASGFFSLKEDFAASGMIKQAFDAYHENACNFVKI
jgi:hypothetical protein